MRRAAAGGAWPSPQLAPPSLWPGLATLGPEGAVSLDEKQVLLLRENQLLGAQPALAFLPCRCLGVGQLPLSLLQDGNWKQSSFSSGAAGCQAPESRSCPLPSLPFPTGDRAGICLRALGEGLTGPSGGFHRETEAGDEEEEPEKQKKEAKPEITWDQEEAM